MTVSGQLNRRLTRTQEEPGAAGVPASGLPASVRRVSAPPTSVRQVSGLLASERRVSGLAVSRRVRAE